RAAASPRPRTRAPARTGRTARRRAGPYPREEAQRRAVARSRGPLERRDRRNRRRQARHGALSAARRPPRALGRARSGPLLRPNAGGARMTFEDDERLERMRLVWKNREEADVAAAYERFR